MNTTLAEKTETTETTEPLSAMINGWFGRYTPTAQEWKLWALVALWNCRASFAGEYCLVQHDCGRDASAIVVNPEREPYADVYNWFGRTEDVLAKAERIADRNDLGPIDVGLEEPRLAFEYCMAAFEQGEEAPHKTLGSFVTHTIATFFMVGRKELERVVVALGSTDWAFVDAVREQIAYLEDAQERERMGFPIIDGLRDGMRVLEERAAA